MTNMPIRIMTDDFRLLDEITRYSSLQLIRSWTGIGSIELRINRYLKGADKLDRGNIIFPHAHLNKAFQIRHKEIELDENGKATENWIIRAPALKSWFSDRLTIPPAGKSQDSIKADAESVMYHYADTQAINPVDPAESLPVIAGVNQHRGDVIDWNSRYKDLAEEMASIGQLSGLGWNIGIDYEAKAFRFDVLQGRDLTAGQSANPPAIFSTEFGTLKSLSYVESDLDYKNVAVVAGQGEGADRRVLTVGDLDATGLDRRVLFVDARDIAEETEEDEPKPRPEADIIRDLENRGMQKLAEHQQEVFLEGQVLMGRTVEKVPKKVEGTFEEVRLDAVDLWENQNLLIGDQSQTWEESHASYKYLLRPSIYSIVPKVKVGDQVTFSLELTAEAETSIRIYDSNIHPHMSFGSQSFDVKKGVNKLTFVKTIVNGTKDNDDWVMDTYNNNNGVKFSITKLKIERGDTSTPWQPAPEDNIPWYHKENTIPLQSIQLSKLGRYQSSRFTFTTDIPAGTSAIVEYSLDNQSWHPLRSGDSLPFTEGTWLTDTTLYLRQRLTTTDQSVTPVIRGFAYEVHGYTEREFISTARLVYGKDYDLGDMVTLQNKEWGVTMDARITEVKEIYEPGNTDIELTFDNSRPTLISKIKQELAGVRNEIVR